MKFDPKELSIWAAILLTLGYGVVKLVITIGLYEILSRMYHNLFLQAELGDFLATLLTLFMLLLIFKKILLDSQKEKISFPNIRIISFLLIIILSLRLIDDPFFRYKEILFDKALPIGSSEEMHITFSLGVLIKGIHFVLIGPIFEELFFRKIIFKSVLNKYSSWWFAILISSILFSITHLSIRNTMPTLLFGATSAYIYYKTCNIWYSIFLHSVSNLLWFFFYINQNIYWQAFAYLDIGVIYWLLVMLGAGLTFLMILQLSKLKYSFS